MNQRQKTTGKRSILWAPQPGPQKALIDCPLPEIFFGGARGGGKTDGVLGKWAIKERRYGKHFNAIMFRRTTVSAEDAIERARQIFEPLGAKFNASKNLFKMPNGGRVAFRYLENVKDADEWQGRNLTDAWVEEAGQYPSPAPIDRLNGVLRSATGVPTQLILTGNPGGAGQHWIRERYQLYPFPERPAVIRKTLPNGRVKKIAVIPSRIEDNRILLENDPTYIDRLYQVGSAALVEAWLNGNWAKVEGAFFDEWSEARHVVRPFAIPDHWLRFRSGDWGSAKPFSFGWWAVASDDTQLSDGRVIPRGALVRYREWYGCKRDVDGALVPDTGLKMHATDAATGIKEREKDEHIEYGVLDTSAWDNIGNGPSVAERMFNADVLFKKATKTRVSRNGIMGGWDMMRERLKGDEEGRPMIFIFKTCKDFIRTVPTLQHDPERPEDLDTHSEDHVADEARYACMSRPWMAETPETVKAPPGAMVLPTIEDFNREAAQQNGVMPRI